MILILNEKELLRKSLEDGYIDEKKTSNTIRILAKHYFSIDMTKEQVYDSIDKFFINNYKKYNSVKWKVGFDRTINAVSKYKDHTLFDINKIEITEKELIRIKSLENIKYEKLAFVLLIYAKIYNLMKKNELGVVKIDQKYIFSDAKVKENQYNQGKILHIIEELGFTDYILLVWDIINFCIQQDIATGLGRGSAAGSLVCYFVGITQIDPIKYDLFFERFISKTRAKKKIIDGIIYLDGNLAPDIDCDISYEDRYKVIEYLHKKHKGKTAKILTINTLSGRLLIKECGKIVGKKSESEMNEISDLIPKLFGTVKDIEKAYGEVADFKKWCEGNGFEILGEIESPIKGDKGKGKAEGAE